MAHGRFFMSILIFEDDGKVLQFAQNTERKNFSSYFFPSHSNIAPIMRLFLPLFSHFHFCAGYIFPFVWMCKWREKWKIPRASFIVRYLKKYFAESSVTPPSWKMLWYQPGWKIQGQFVSWIQMNCKCIYLWKAM